MRKFVTHDEAACLLPLRIQRNQFSVPRTRTLFFLSFADAFRGLMQSRDRVAQTILAPDFYCPETLAMYATYGNVVLYPIKDDLMVDEEAYIEAVRSAKPDIIVHYGFFGFPSASEKIRSFLKSFPEVLVIEDYAHKIFFQEEVGFIHRNHVYIDSIRKQTSLLGSHLICPWTDMNEASFQKMNTYKLHCAFLQTVREGIILLAELCQFEWLYQKSQDYFDLLDGVIGTSEYATMGGSYASAIWTHIDFKKIINHKRELIQVYTSRLAEIQSKYFQIPSIVAENITYFPCLVSPEVRDKLIKHLEKNNIWIGSLWEAPHRSELRLNVHLLERVVVLPLTWKTSKEDAVRTCAAVKDFFNIPVFKDNERREMV